MTCQTSIGGCHIPSCILLDDAGGYPYDFCLKVDLFFQKHIISVSFPSLRKSTNSKRVIYHDSYLNIYWSKRR